MSFDVDIGYHSQRGPRAGNEDFAGAALPPADDEARGLVAAIADGVSSGGGGREAAQTTVMSLLGDFHATPDTWDTSVALDRVIGAQNAWLADHNRRRQTGEATAAEARVALTTLTALVLRGQSWTVAHVGDTRAWLLRDGEIVQLTQDHAFEEAFQRSRLTRALGLDDSVRIDFAEGALRLGDTFLLTSDGVHGVLPRAQLQALMQAQASSQASSQAISQAIVQAAAAAGTRDNATALVLRVRQMASGRFEDLLRSGRNLPALGRLKIGHAVDGYVITALIADTGVHRLYQARVAASGALVVLKTLHEARAGDEQERAMLAHEAWLATRIANPKPRAGEAGFVCVHQVENPSAHYMVFDWHPGVTLQDLQARGRRFDVAAIVAGSLAVARALARLHRHGVIHRDIKPGNLHLGDDGHWRVLDLGAALSGRDPPALRLLRAGTPSYMNPEQWGRDGAEPKAADEGGDVYALGVTLYQWLTGKLPYGVVEPYQAGRFRRDPKPPSRLRPEVPIWLDHVVLKAVALDPQQRFETAEEMVLALERGAVRPLAALQGTPLMARDPTALWKIALAASLLFNALLVYWLLFLPR